MIISTSYLDTDMLFEQTTLPYLGSLKNRVVMSAMTRGFANQNHECTEAMCEYYSRRARNDVGLILTEGIIIDPSGDGYNNVPHLSNDGQALSWKPTTKAVQHFGTKIFAQLWHCGRISHQDFTGGLQPVSSSAIRAEGTNRQNNKAYAVPRSLDASEIPEIINAFVNAANLALTAGFNGVELHFGHGYLIDQFFDARINKRTDQYGGSVENRCRLALEIVTAVLSAVGPERLTVRISPSRYMGEIYEWGNKDQMLAFLIPALNNIGLRMLDISCANAKFFETAQPIIQEIREICHWKHIVIGGASLTLDDAENEICSGRLDLVTWGRAILANPNFVQRMQENAELLEMTPEIRNRLF